MDKLDAKILDLLQGNGELSAAEIADRVGLSKAPCWRRIQKLQHEGIIRRTVALLDAHALNVGTTVFVTLKTGNHSEAWFEKFVRAVRDIPEVTEIHRMSGDVDYLIRIVVPDIDAYDVVYKRLICAGGVPGRERELRARDHQVQHRAAVVLREARLSPCLVVADDLRDACPDRGAVNVVGARGEHRLARWSLRELHAAVIVHVDREDG